MRGWSHLRQLVALGAELSGMWTGARKRGAGLLAGSLLLQPDGRRDCVQHLGHFIPAVDLADASVGFLSGEHNSPHADRAVRVLSLLEDALPGFRPAGASTR